MAFLAIFKTQPAPEILADDKYPPWVWTMNQVVRFTVILFFTC